jgi:hypothetical protein
MPPYGDLPKHLLDRAAPLPAGRRSYEDHARALRAETLRELLRGIGRRLRRG